MATSLADPLAPPGQQPPAAPADAAAGSAAAGIERVCTGCGAPMKAAQDWCLRCGAGAPGSLRLHGHEWRSAGVVLSALALLVAGAAVAAYAALSKSSTKPRAPLSALARTPVPPAGGLGTAVPPPPAAATPAPVIPKVAPPAAVKPLKPLVPLVKPKTPAPHAKSPAATTTPTTTTPSSSTTKTPTGGGTTSAEKLPAAIVLDTNAASTYNPYSYPASNFGDPSLAIDGDRSTAWTAVVEPSVAPKMAEGLLIDLKTARKLSALALTTDTPGMTVQLYGALGLSAPSPITDTAWVHLSGVLVVKKAHTRIILAGRGRAFRFVTLWISQAPSSAVVTPQAPGRVRVNEVELFPAR